MEFPSLVGICGDVGSGKSTVADYLLARHGYVVGSLADKLKLVAMDVFGLERRHVLGSQADKAEELDHVRDAAGTPRTGRRILELLGTEGFRTVDPDVWVKYLCRNVVDPHLRSGERVVIPDLRFPNEFRAVRERGGIVWRTLCVGGPNSGVRTGHVSDEAWRAEAVDYRLVAQYGDLEGLAGQAELALLHWRRSK